MADTNKMKNDQIIRDSIDSRALIGAESDSIAKSLGGSQKRKAKYDEEQRIKRDLQRGLVKGADPYDNTPGGSKVPKDKLMSLTNGAYTATLLEKILKASDNSQFQNSTLKFQEQALNYMQTISADVKSLVEYLKPKAVEQQEDEDNELKMEMTNMAKALSSLDVEGIAREIGKSIYSKMDSGGYGDLVKTMYQSLKDTIQGGEFSQMVKGMIQNTMLSQLPKEWQQNIQQFRDDPVKLMQLQLNKLGRSDNNVIRDIFGSFIRREKPNTELQEKKVDLSAKAMFDNKFYMSVTKVIPEQLYRIVAALEGHEISAFDWDKQDYLTATEIWAKAHKNNMAASPEAVQRRVMDIFSYSFEQMAEKPGSGNLRSMFQLNNEGKLDKDQITGHVKFRNNRVKNVLTQMVKSGIDISALQYARPEIILKELDLKWKSDAERGAILQDIYMVQNMLRNIDFEDRSDLISDVSDLREEIHNRVRDNSADFLTAQEMGVIERIMYNPNLTADQKKDLLAATNQRGIHVWGDGVFGGSGSGGGTRRGPLPPIFGPSTSTDTEGILNTLNQATSRPLNDRELNDARTLFEDFVAGKASNRNVKKLIPVSERDKYLAKLNDMYGMGAIKKSQFEHLSTFNSKDELQGADAGVFKDGGLKIELAHKLYGILTDAGYTAEAKAAQLGISVQEAKARGYVGDAFELMKVIEITNGEATINKSKMQKFNMTYLSDENQEYLKKFGRQRQRSVLGNGSIDQQISKSLSGIFGDPKIANKAGMALGGAAGLGVHKLLKSAGVMQDPRFGWILGGVGAGLMTMERSRNFIDNVFGPAGDVKGANGFTNKEIFMAKAMTKYLPMIGVGGKTAHAIIKATSAFGPLGKVFGMVAGPIIGFGMGKAASSLLEKGRDWLFNPDRDKNSKLGKLASFLKEIPGVKKLFALGDDRIEEEVILDSLKQTLSYYQAKAAEAKAKGGPGYAREIQALNRAITRVEKAARVIKSELEKENKENETPDQGIISDARQEINDALDEVNKALGTEGADIRKRFEEEQMEARDSQNRMRAAADQKYNNIGEERRERISEIIGQYYEASDENARSFREYLSGEGDSIMDLISDNELRQRFDRMLYRHSIGKDISEEYAQWLQDFQAKDQQGYESFMEATQGGARRSAMMNGIISEIKRDLIDNQHFKGTDAELQNEAERQMMMALNHKSFGRMARDFLGEAGMDSYAKFMSRFNGLDSEDIQKEKDARNFVNAMNTSSQIAEDTARENEQARLRAEAERVRNQRDADASMRSAHMEDLARTMGTENWSNNKIKRYWMSHYGYNGSSGLTKDEIVTIKNMAGRGTEPVKMKQMEKLKFASGESLGIAGCSVAAIINALVYMGLDAPEPDTLIGIANNYLTKDGGVTSDFFLEVAKNLGIKASIYNNKENVFTVDVFKQFKVGKDNGLICLLKNQFSAGYHYVTIKSASGRKLVVDDPETKGLTQTTAAEIVSRVVEIVSLQTIAQTSITEETTMDPTKSGTTLASGARQTGSSVKQVAKDAIADVASAAINKISGGATKALGKWAGLVEALKNAVFNVRIVDDFTLPLKMGDAEAALAVSRMQAAAASSSGASATKYVQAIKKMMMNKDVQNEMNESDLMQETIINGGLVAGGSTGAGGRGTTATSTRISNNTTIGNGKPGGTWGDAIRQDAKAFGLGMMTRARNLVGIGASAIPLLAHSAGAYLSLPFFKSAQQRADEAYNNLTGTITDEEAQQKFDENGNQIQRGKFRDWGGILRSTKDAVALAKGGLGIHGLISKGLQIGGNALKKSNKKLLVKVGEGMTGTLTKGGMVKTMLNLINKVLIEAPLKMAEMISTKKLSFLAGDSGIIQKAVGGLINLVKKMCSFIGKKLAPSLSKKMASVIGTKAGGGLLKKILNKIPGGPLITAGIQMPISGYTGFTHAAQYLDRKPETVTFWDKIMVAMVKIAYDCLPDVIWGAMTVANPVVTVCGDIVLALVRGVFTFEECLVMAGLKDKEWKGDDDDQKKAEEAAAGVENLIATGKVDSVYKDNVEAIQSSNFTAHHEGFRNQVYRDSKGIKTIGYGFNLESGRFTKEQVDRWTREGITETEARQVLNDELAKTREQLANKYPWFKTLDPVRQGAIIDMAYNMGMGGDKKGLGSFKKALAAMEKGDYETAAKEFLDSQYAKDVGSRANAIADLIRYGNGAGFSGQAPDAASNGWLMPIKGSPLVTSAFGERDVPDASSPHMGVDIRGTSNDPIFATKDGKVVFSGGDFGTIRIKHPDGTESVYMHTSKRFVNVGQDVKKGDKIGMIGGTGPKGPHHYNDHLHFETIVKGKQVDPFIELGLNKNNLKLSTDGSSKENWDYLYRNPWLNSQAKNVADQKAIKYADNNGKPSTNKEAGGPSLDPYSYNSRSNNMTVINRDSHLERYVQSLDAKFNQMIDLLSKLVNISQENANNVLSDAMAPARI